MPQATNILNKHPSGCFSGNPCRIFSNFIPQRVSRELPYGTKIKVIKIRMQEVLDSTSFATLFISWNYIMYWDQFQKRRIIIGDEFNFVLLSKLKSCLLSVWCWVVNLISPCGHVRFEKRWFSLLEYPLSQVIASWNSYDVPNFLSGLISSPSICSIFLFHSGLLLENNRNYLQLV